MVTLRVYNLLGQEVITLVRGVQQSGQHSVIWDGRGSSGQSVASGVYLYRLEAGGSVVTNKMILMK
jgi:flagellar hook assembly protein FlgD